MKREKSLLETDLAAEDPLADIDGLNQDHEEQSILRRVMDKIGPSIRGFEQYSHPPAAPRMKYRIDSINSLLSLPGRVRSEQRIRSLHLELYVKGRYDGPHFFASRSQQCL